MENGTGAEICLLLLPAIQSVWDSLKLPKVAKVLSQPMLELAFFLNSVQHSLKRVSWELLSLWGSITGSHRCCHCYMITWNLSNLTPHCSSTWHLLFRWTEPPPDPDQAVLISLTLNFQLILYTSLGCSLLSVHLLSHAQFILKLYSFHEAILYNCRSERSAFLYN